MNPRSHFRIYRLILAVCLGAVSVGIVSAASLPDKAQSTNVTAVQVGFDFLAGFPYEIPSDPPAGTPAVRTGQIPSRILELDRRRVALTGYLIPLVMENFFARQFLLVRSPAACCYGVAPNINEFAIVTMTGKGARPIMDTPVTVVGTLKVGEVYENGFLSAIYRIEGETVAPPPEPAAERDAKPPR